MSEKTCAHIYDAHLIYDDPRVNLVHLDLICVSCKQHLRIDVTHECVYEIMRAMNGGRL